ncbi:hypothetical protein [Glycomyces arizonensis]|nr:hypothetical protein [Glycomyces arizonensis]
MSGRAHLHEAATGSKIHALTDRNGLTPTLAVAAVNLHDSQAFEP